MTADILLQSTLTCPECGFMTAARMPVDACQFFWECASCRRLIRPLPGDCCVFCSYGSVRCPSRQSGTCAHKAVAPQTKSTADG